MFKRSRLFIKKATSYEYLEDSSRYIFKILKTSLSISKKIEPGESTAIVDLDINEKCIAQAKNSFKFFVIIYMIFAIMIFTYSLICFFRGSFDTALIGTSATIVCLTLSFKYHFWMTQIRLGRVGITFKDWMNNFLKVTK